jgi:hypothetical protein
MALVDKDAIAATTAVYIKELGMGRNAAFLHLLGDVL